MRSKYDFSNGIRNPYTGPSTMNLMLRLDPATLQYFKDLAISLKKPYPEIIASYLDECATQKRTLQPE